LTGCGTGQLQVAVFLQFLQVGQGIVETVHVVYSDPGNHLLPDQPEQKSVGLLEDRRILHPDGGEPVDVEEPSIVDLLGRHSPIGKTVDLSL